MSGAHVVEGQAEVIQASLVGVGDLAGGRDGPEELGVELGEDAVALLAEGEGLLVALALGDVDAHAAEGDGDTVDDGSLGAGFEPDDLAVLVEDAELDADEFAGLD